MVGRTEAPYSLTSMVGVVGSFAASDPFLARRKRKQGFLSTSLVGVAGFEPTASSSRTKRATKLRYTPLPWIRCPEQPSQHSRAQSDARK